MSNLESGSVVWVRLGQAWWPGTVTTLEKCPPEFVKGLRKTPVAVVKFFHENEFQDVHKAEHIYPYACDRKEEFIRRGLYINKNQSHGEVDLLRKFESDVVTAEKLTGGDMDILQTIGEVAGKRRVDYSDLGFGLPKAKKKKDEGAKRGSDIGQAVVYKKSGLKGNNKIHRVIIEHKVRILEQPKRETIEDSMSASNWFKCYVCGFTCTRLNVIVWHNKAHLKKVYNFDTGIKIPGRRRRKGISKTNKDGKKRGRTSKGKGDVDHALTNGEVSNSAKGGHDTQQLLQDWDDDDDVDVINGVGGANRMELPSGMGKDNSDDDYSDNGDYPPPQPNHERRPMPKAADINSAFDALLATTPSSVTTPSAGQTSNYVNNDSDSDYSDWEKYYDKGSGSDQDDDDDDVAPVSDIKSICEESLEKSDSLMMEQDNKMNIDSDKKDETLLNTTALDAKEFVEMKIEESVASIREEASSTVKSEEKAEIKSVCSQPEEKKSPFSEKSNQKAVKDFVDTGKDESKKSSADIYEYVDEFCESAREPYEPPKKPYESLQKYRLLQEARRSPQEASRSSLYEDSESSRESYGTKDKSYDYKHESTKMQTVHKENEPHDASRLCDSQESLADYESGDEVETEGKKSLQLSDNESDREETEFDKQKGHSNESPYVEEPCEPKASEICKDYDDVKRTQECSGKFEAHEGEVHKQETSRGYKQRETEYSLVESDIGKSEGTSKSYEAEVMSEDHVSRPHSQQEFSDSYHPQGSYEEAKESEGQKKYRSGTHETCVSAVQDGHSESLDVQEESVSQDACVPVTSETTDRQAGIEGDEPVFRKLDDQGTSVSTFIEEEISCEEPAYQISVGSVRKEESDVRVTSHTTSNREGIEEMKHVAEASQDIEDFTKDLDKLTQNIDRLTQNIDPESTQSDSVREKLRKSFEGYEEDSQVYDETPEVLNLSTQDRNINEREVSAGKSAHDHSSSHSRGGSAHEKVHPPKQGDHSVSSSSGTTYMLVAVDAHGNTIQTVPTSTLKDGSNLMAMEATLEDGTTRTLYIDPSQLGPDVDLNNLILQEQVI